MTMSVKAGIEFFLKGRISFSSLCYTITIVNPESKFIRIFLIGKSTQNG